MTREWNTYWMVERGFMLAVETGLTGDSSPTRVSSRARDATDPARECIPRFLVLAGFFTDPAWLADSFGAPFGEGPGRLTTGVDSLRTGEGWRTHCTSTFLGVLVAI